MARLQAAGRAASAALGTWGEPTPMPDAVALARLEADMVGKVMALASDPKDALARALGSLGGVFMARELVSFTGLHEVQRNIPQLQYLSPPSADRPNSTGRRKQGCS